MTEPVTTQKNLIVPNTGDLSGAWGTSALNPNFQTIDALFGGVTTISLSTNTTFFLTVPATNGVWPGGSVSQSVNSLIRFTGAQTGSATVIFSLPGYYIVENKCTGTTTVRLQPSTLTGNCIGAIPGKKCHVFYDGTHMDYLNQSDPGTAYDLHTNTNAYPPWMLVCTALPYLLKDGTVYPMTNYPALGAALGSTFGGNGVTTFGVPDERGRFRLGIDNTAARVTIGVSGVDGTRLGASGGNQSLQAHVHAATAAVTDPGHQHAYTAPVVTGAGSAGGAFTDSGVVTATTVVAQTNISVAVGITSSGNGASQNIPPCIVSILPFIKT